jgi:uncharacterized lipoprotein
MRVAWIVLIAGCGFQARASTGEAAAPVPDAGVDIATCPASYGVTLPGSGSRYRLIPDGRPAWTQSDACAADLPGATHLVVLDSRAELDGATALVAAPTTALAGNAIWVGAVQQITAALPAADWLWLDGTAVTGWGGVEPNDRDRQENREEQFARIEKGKLYLQDSAGSGNNSALCECDGKSISQAAATALAANRPGS